MSKGSQKESWYQPFSYNNTNSVVKIIFSQKKKKKQIQLNITEGWTKLNVNKTLHNYIN